MSTNDGVVPESSGSATNNVSEEGRLIADSLNLGIAHAKSEVVALLQYEVLHGARFPNLSDSINKDFDDVMNGLTEHLGGPPEFYLVKKGEHHKVPRADTYPETILREALDVFSRARKSVIRAHLFYSAKVAFEYLPETIEEAYGSEMHTVLRDQNEILFWEHAETAYIRLYSFWDRIGQILDFAFFNIRKFDHNGFYSVMERIKANAVPMNQPLKASRAWVNLEKFKNSAGRENLRWLLERRNLMVHRLHLHPLKVGDAAFLEGQYNHLSDAHREKLMPQKPEVEVEILVDQLEKASKLFSSVIDVVMFAPSRKGSNFIY